MEDIDMKMYIYKFLILLLQFVCGCLVMKYEWGFITEFMLIILPFSVISAVLFTVHDKEINKG